MRDRNKYFLKEAVVLLIAVFMVSSTVPAVLANTGDTELQSEQGDFTSAGKPSIPKTGTPLGKTRFDKTEAFDGVGVDEWYYLHNGPSHDPTLATDSISLTGTGTMYTGITLDFSAEIGNEITKVSYLDYSDGTGAGLDGTFKIYTGSLGGSPTEVYSQDFITTDSGAFEDLTLTTPVEITQAEMSVSFEVTQTAASQFVFAVDSGPMVPNGGYISTTGSFPYDTLAGLGFDYNWLQEVYVASAGPGPAEDCIPDACDFEILDFTDEFNAQSNAYDIDGDGINDYFAWNSLPKDICIQIANKGEIGIGELKLMAEIYEKVCGQTITIFDDPKYDLTKFPCCGTDYPIEFPEVGDWMIEDDEDMDSWVLQGGAENRWLTNNQAWRCTKGEDRTYGVDEDIYLGKSDMSLPDQHDTLTTPMFDISGAACAELSFSHWCEGEYTINEDGLVDPTDYGTIAYSLDDGATWTEISQSDFLAYDTEDEWVPVTLKFLNTEIDTGDEEYKHPYGIICDDCIPGEDDIVISEDLRDAQLRMKFIWQKDPCLQFEGWYIDDLSVEMTLDYELELAHQTHQIMELDPCDPEEGVQYQDYCFPISFDPEDDTWYEIHIFGQVFNPSGCEADIENNELKFQFKIQDIHDMACVEIESPDDGKTLNPGDNVPINVTVQNLGTFAENNVPVELKAGNLISTKVNDDNFESNTLGDYTAYYFNLPSGPTKVPIEWSKGWEEISEIYDDDPAQARSLNPGSECLVFAEHGGFPTLPEDTGTAFMAGQTIDLDPNGNGKDCADPVNAKMTFAAKWSMELEEYFYYYSGAVPESLGSTVLLAIAPTEGPGAGYVVFTDFGVAGDPDGYENDWQSFDLDLYDILEGSLIGNDFAGETYDTLPEVEIGFFVYAEGPNTEADMNYLPDTPDGGCANALNPVPWTGFMVDNWKIILEDYDDASLETIATLNTGELQPGDTETLQGSYNVELCTNVITAETQLENDINPSNDGCCAVVVTGAETERCFDYRVEDITGGGECLWDVCCNRETADDCFAWAGRETAQSAQYINNMDDYLVSPGVSFITYNEDGTVDKDYTPFGVVLNFTTWYEFYNKDDFGSLEMYSEFDHDNDPETENLTTWNRIWKTSGTTTDGVFKDQMVYIPQDVCDANPNTRFRFRMYSDDAGVDEGFYIDDIQLVDVTGVPPPSLADAWISYNDGYTDDALAWTDGSAWTEAIELSSPELDDYRGDNVCEILVSCGADEYGFYAEDYEVYCAQGSLPDMGTIGDDETLVASGTASATGWTPVTFDTLYEIPNSGPVFVIVKWLAGYAGYPAGFDTDNTDSRGQHMLDHGSTDTWTTVGALGYPSVWGLDAGICAGAPEELEYGEPLYGIFQGPDTSIEDFEDKDISPWTCQPGEGGQHWIYSEDEATIPNEAEPLPDDPCAECGSGWYTIPSANLVPWGYNQFGTGINNAIAFKLDLTDPVINPNYIKFGASMNYNFANERAYIEFSPDWDGESPMESATWVQYWVHTPGDVYGDDTGGWITLEDLTAKADPHPGQRWNIDEYAGEIVWVRFRLETDGNGAAIGEGWAIDDVHLEIKPTGTEFEDDVAPQTSLFFNEDTAMVTLVAIDLPINKGVGVDATYYKVDGGSTQTYGGPFTISEGTHTVEYWSVDNNGNEELPHKTTELTVDTTPPVVEIILPEEGKIYLFGSPIMNRIFGEKTLCFGKVPVEATATDDSGIKTVLFKYNNETHWDSTSPYTHTFNEMHFGALTISVSAIDNKGLTSTPVTMEIMVYSLGLF